MNRAVVINNNIIYRFENCCGEKGNMPAAYFPLQPQQLCCEDPQEQNGKGNK